MSRPIVNEYNVITQENISREMNDEEYSQYLIDKEITDTASTEMLAEKLQADAAKAAVEEKLAALGLDLETVKLIAKLG